MRAIFTLCLLLATMLGGMQAKATDKPRVVSINVCTDQMLLTLADPEQILSLTFLSHDESASVYRDEALQYPTNKGVAEEAIALQPDLVLAGAFTSKYTLQLLERAGVAVKTVSIASSIDEVMSNMTDVGGWLQQGARAQSLVDQMNNRLSDLPPVPASRPRAAIYDPRGYTVGAGTLRGQILDLAGWHNVSDDRGIQQYGTLALETVLKLEPDVLISSPYSADTWSRGQAVNRHPALLGSGSGIDVVHVPSAQTICGGPWTVDVVEKLAKVREGYRESGEAGSGG